MFSIMGSGRMPSRFHFARPSLLTSRGVLLSSFHEAQSKPILVGLSFRLGPSNVGHPLARDLLLRAGSGNIDQSEDFIAMMHD